LLERNKSFANALNAYEISIYIGNENMDTHNKFDCIISILTFEMIEAYFFCKKRKKKFT
jgi:hypothetical protein